MNLKAGWHRPDLKQGVTSGFREDNLTNKISKEKTSAGGHELDQHSLCILNLPLKSS